MNVNLFLSCDDVAKLLKIKVSTIYGWLHHNQLPSEIYVKLGRKPLFIEKKLIQWIMNGAKLKPKLRKERNYD